MWSVRTEMLADARGMQCLFDVNGQQASYNDILHAWKSDASFRQQFNLTLAEVPFTAYRWETPAVTIATLDQRFACVLLDSPGLARHPDVNAFAEHFPNAENDVAVFDNLGRDALMIVPCPVAEANAYGHLAAFVRSAPTHQQQALWEAVAEAMLQRISAKPVWLSTAGAGVSWLHVRLDNYPKYYGYDPYRRGG